jgi:preprotein translocase YajC subunit
MSWRKVKIILLSKDFIVLYNSPVAFGILGGIIMKTATLLQLGGLVMIFVVMYMAMIRPQKKREKAVQSMRSALKPGDKVTTIGGIKGKVVKTNDQTITISVGADKVKFEIMRWAISSLDEVGAASRVSRVSEEPEEEEEAQEEIERPAKKPRKLGAKASEKEEETEEPVEAEKEPEEEIEEDDE